MPLPVRGIVLPVLAALCLCASPDVAAQFVPSGRAEVAPAPRSTSQAPDEPLVLSGPIDPTTYVVGPGDVFAISIGGVPSGPGTVAVTADGLLVLPQAGTIRAAGRTLAVVRADAQAELRRLFRNVPTDVALAVPRRFAVFVSGAVPVPGRQALSATARLEDALTRAAGEFGPLGLTDYATPPLAGGAPRVALRNIRVTSPGGGIRTVDLLRYYATGDLAFNPMVGDGDVLFLSTFDPAREAVAVSGDVERPGYYDVRPDDSAAALLAVAGRAPRGVGTVRRTRVVDGRAEVREAPLADAATLDIRPRDQLSVRAGIPGAGFASALGAFAFPGAYPIVEGETTLADLIGAAGGLTSDALARGAYLERPARPLLTDRPGAAEDSMLTVGPGRLSDLGPAGRRYFAEEVAAAARVSIDLVAALGGGPAIPLRDGDRVVVPEDLGVIRVTGQVGDPGFVTFQPGLTAGDYVARAGGLGPVATTVYTVDGRTGLFQAGSDTAVAPGDAVFVDRPPTFDSPAFQSLGIQEQGQLLQARSLTIQEENLALQARRDRQTVVFQTIQVVATALSALAAVYVAATR